MALPSTCVSTRIMGWEAHVTKIERLSVATPCHYDRGMLITKHEGVTFQNQTVYISGQAFVKCQFHGCTLVLREGMFQLDGCQFDRCNWHVDYMLMWGNPESLRAVKSLVTLIEQAQSQLPAAQAALQAQQQRPANA